MKTSINAKSWQAVRLVSVWIFGFFVFFLGSEILSASSRESGPGSVGGRSDEVSSRGMGEDVSAVLPGRSPRVVQENPSQRPADLLRRAFSDEESLPVRWRSLIQAAEVDPAFTLPKLEEALKHREWFMRNAALVALQTAAPERVQSAALDLLRDRALVVRSAAVAAIDASLARARLWQELKEAHNFRNSQSLWVRGEIVAKLAVAPQVAEIKLFTEALRDKDERLHEPAMAALEKITQRQAPSEAKTVSEKRSFWLLAAGNFRH